LLPELLKVISGSEAITIVLITSGEGIMRGTPFDEQINAAWKEWHDEQEGAQMPLVTVLRARLDEITDWSLTPAPRPIELPAVTANLKAGGEGTNGLAKDVLAREVEKRAQSSKWGPEQQVAFSVWALGRTGMVATASSPTNEMSAASHKCQAQAENAKEATVRPNINPSAEGIENRASNVTTSFVAPQETPAKLAFKATERSEEHKQENAKDSQVSDHQPIHSLEHDSEPTAATQPSPISDASLGAPMVAHARASDPARDNETGQSLALATPPRSFLRENVNPLVLLIVAAFGAGYCFRNWFLTSARPAGTTMSLTRMGKDE
jgi:hypothetical protein